MKVAFNSLPLKSGHKVRGVGTYTRNLLEELRQREDIEVQEFGDISEVKCADVVHYPFFDLFQRTLPLQSKFPTVVTIYDVIPLAFPEHYPPGIKGKINYFYQRLALNNVPAIITISQFSKDEIVQYLRVNPQKVYPIYLAASDKFKLIKDTQKIDVMKKKHNLPKKYAIYIGNVNWNKNLLNMAQASIDAGVELVLVGKSFENMNNLDHPELRSYKEFLGRFKDLKNIHILGFIPENDLVIIMNGADILLFPSFSEGFGLPILEAQVCGLPVITSNISSMPEVAGGRAVLVDPYNVKEITGAIKKIISDEKFRKDLIEKGFENNKRFSWKKTVEQTLAVYEKICR